MQNPIEYPQQKGFAIEKEEGVSEHWRNDDCAYVVVVVGVQAAVAVFEDILDVVAVAVVYVAGTAVEEMFDVAVHAFTFDIFVAVGCLLCCMLLLFLMMLLMLISFDILEGVGINVAALNTPMALILTSY